MSFPGLRIRAAREADLTAIVALEQSIAEAPHWPEREYVAMLNTDQATTEPVMRCLLVAEAENAECLFGLAVGKIVGPGPKALAEVESIIVDQAARRRGVGTALCAAIAAWSRQRGAATLELEARESNLGAIALYSQLGFVHYGRRRAYYHRPDEDAVLMRLELEKCN